MYLRTKGCPWDAETCHAAAEGGHLQVLLWAALRGCPWNELTCASAAKGGHLELLKYARANGCPWDKRTCMFAAEGEHHAVVQWYLDELDRLARNALPGLPLDVVFQIIGSANMPDTADLARLRAVSRAMRDAVAKTRRQVKELDPWTATRLGCLNTLQRMVRQGRLERKEYLCAAAARSGQLEELKSLRADDEARAQAVMGGHFDVLKWLHANDAPCEESACAAAAATGNFEVMKWLRENGCPLSRSACARACEDNQIGMLKWLIANDAPIDGYHLPRTLAEKGHLDILKSLWPDAKDDLMRSMSFTKALCPGAAKGGQLEVLKWARSIGSSWGYPNDAVCNSAAESGNLDMLKFAHRDGAPCYRMACMLALKNGHVEVRKYLRANGCPWYQWTCMVAAREGQIEVLKWLREIGKEWNSETCWEAAKGGHLEVLKWARANGCEWDRNACLRVAKAGDHVEVRKWLSANGE